MRLRFKTITIFGNFKTAVANGPLARLLRGSPLQKEEVHMTGITIAEVIVPKETENQKHKVK